MKCKINKNNPVCLELISIQRLKNIWYVALSFVAFKMVGNDPATTISNVVLVDRDGRHLGDRINKMENKYLINSFTTSLHNYEFGIITEFAALLKHNNAIEFNR